MSWRRRALPSAILASACSLYLPACRPAEPPAPAASGAVARSIVLDDFASLAGWRAVPAEGVSLALHRDSGPGGSGHAMRLDVDVSRGGYAIARRELDLPLPANYEITFWLRGEMPRNTLEVKLVDESGENVWWHVRRDLEWPGEWERVRVRKRQIEFAWGPRGGGELERAAAIELAITAGAGGGSGSVWIGEMAITPLEPVIPYDLTPVASASSSRQGQPPSHVLDGDGATAWRSGDGGDQWLALDFLRSREYGGLVIDWEEGLHAVDYSVETSLDGRRWESAHEVTGSIGGRDWIPLPDTESRWLRVAMRRGARAHGYGIRALRVQPLEWAATKNDFFHAVAAESKKGSHPRYLHGEQSYWTVIGTAGGREEALMNEDGAIEPRRVGPSVEPFLQIDGRLVSWSDVHARQTLERGWLPIPTVVWSVGDLSLAITAVADPENSELIHVRYLVRNNSARARRPVLWLAVRPFQVNPSWQFLGTPGGAAPLGTLRYTGHAVIADGSPLLFLETPPDGFAGGGFHGGGALEAMRTGRIPADSSVHDPFGYASAALSFELDIPPGGANGVYVRMPLTASASSAVPAASSAAARFDALLGKASDAWTRDLERVRIRLPGDGRELEYAVRSTLGWILINRSGPAIQPGTRSYRRSWIRDGSLTSAALLRLGHHDAVREFIEWYAPFQYENGKVPCCVDHRGADPVPEHDSHGQLIWLIAQYVRFTGDSALAARLWPRVRSAVSYMDSLRASRMTEPYRSGDSTAYFGLLPQSISHEGYAAKPMHSFWDDLFGIRGYKDAAWLAALLGMREERRELERRESEFRRDVMASYRAAMRMHDIDYLPGAVELGDFDATSTTVGVAPLNETAHLPRPALERTFERWVDFFRARRDGREEWEAYTPYEWRIVGTLIRLGRPEDAHEVARWFLDHRRPTGWNHWAEVVWRDERAPRFIGDMPHGWVGSDFIRSVLDMLAWEREADSALVVASGVPAHWAVANGGVRVERMSTPWGSLDITIRGAGDTVRVSLSGALAVPPGGIVVRAPFGRAVREVRTAGVRRSASETVIRRLPADVLFRYEPAPDSSLSATRP